MQVLTLSQFFPFWLPAFSHASLDTKFQLGDSIAGFFRASLLEVPRRRARLFPEFSQRPTPHRAETAKDHLGSDDLETPGWITSLSAIIGTPVVDHSHPSHVLAYNSSARKLLPMTRLITHGSQNAERMNYGEYLTLCRRGSFLNPEH